MLVLLVEDEDRVARFIARGLAAEGMQCTVARDGAEGLEHCLHGDQDLIILDRMLPRLDGLKVCQRMRAAGVTTPVLMLTALDTVEERVEGLRAGADDYLVKPFDFEELLARIEALSRRGASPPLAEEVCCSGIQLNLSTRDVTVNGEAIVITAREFDLLRLLATTPGRYWSRERILNRVWGTTATPDTNVVDVYIGRLRRKLDIGETPPVIETLRGVGYRLAETHRA